LSDNLSAFAEQAVFVFSSNRQGINVEDAALFAKRYRRAQDAFHL
jgi:hypothetical protein